MIQSLNRTLRGWFEYFKHSYHNDFPCARRLDPHAAAEASSANAAAAAAVGAVRTIIAGPTPTLPSRAVQLDNRPCFWPVNPLGGNKPTILESRMREIRLSGSEGGRAELNRPSYPYRFVDSRSGWLLAGTLASSVLNNTTLAMSIKDHLKAAKQKADEAISLNNSGKNEQAIGKWGVVLGSYFPKYG